MIKSIIADLKEKDMQVVVNTYNLNEYYYPTLFPLKFTPTLTWKSLIADIGARVMADVVSFDSKAPRKSREVVGKATGDIPKISIGRDKTETEMNEYRTLLYYANTTEGSQAIMDWIYDDIEFCFNGVNNRLEWLALRAASTGKFSMTKDNNAGIVTAVDVDFLIPDGNKSGTGTDPLITAANAATSKPITKVKAIVKLAKAKGFKFKVIYTTLDTVDNILISAETTKLVAPWLVQATNLQQSPTMDALNSYMSQNGLPVFKVIDSTLTYEDKANKRTVLEPWEPGVMLFSENITLGNTWWSGLSDDLVTSDQSIKVKRGHILIKKFANPEPLMESTVAMANAFPSLGNPDRLFLVDTLHTGFLVTL